MRPFYGLNPKSDYERPLEDCVDGRNDSSALDDFPQGFVYLQLQNGAGMNIKHVIKRVSVIMHYNPSGSVILSEQNDFNWTLRGSNDEYKGQPKHSMSWTPIEVIEQQVHAHEDDVPYADTHEPFKTINILKSNGELAYNLAHKRRPNRAWVRYDIITANDKAYNLYHIGVTPSPRPSGAMLNEILFN